MSNLVPDVQSPMPEIYSEESKPQILFFDDLPGNITAYEQALIDAGYNCKCARTLTKAEDIICMEKIDLLVLDIKAWPSLQERGRYREDWRCGLQLYKYYKSDLEKKNIPVIFLSNYYYDDREWGLVDAEIKGTRLDFFSLKELENNPDPVLSRVNQLLGGSGM